MGSDPSVKVLQALGRARALHNEAADIHQRLLQLHSQLFSDLHSLEIALSQLPTFQRFEGPASYAGGDPETPHSV